MSEAKAGRQLPQGWRWVQLGEVCNLVNGDTYRESDWSQEGVPIIRIQNLNDLTKPFNYWAGETYKKVVVNSGDVLLAWSGTPGTSFGTHLWSRGLGVLNQHIFRVDFDRKLIEPKWVVFAINAQLEHMISKAHGGVGLRHIKKSEVESIKLAIPTLPEQQRIAARLNEQMTTVERARAAAEAQLEVAKVLPAAYLRAVFSGIEAQNWPRTNIAEITSLVVDGPHVTPSYLPKGIPFLTVRNIVNRKFDLSTVRYISESDHAEFCRRGKAEVGDILYTKDGTLGVPCVVEENYDFSFFVSVALIKLLRDRADPRFIAFALESPDVLEQVNRLGAGAGLKHMVLKSIRALEVPVPPIHVQVAITTMLQEKISSSNRIRGLLEEKLEMIKRLPASLLRQAFNGEL